MYSVLLTDKCNVKLFSTLTELYKFRFYCPNFRSLYLFATILILNVELWDMVAHGLFYFEKFDRKLPVIYFNTIEI